MMVKVAVIDRKNETTIEEFFCPLTALRQDLRVLLLDLGAKARNFVVAQSDDYLSA
jgi:hypothetical protein